MQRSQRSHSQSSRVSQYQQRDSYTDLVRDGNLFNNWAKSVRLDPDIRGDSLPTTLRDLLEDSLIAPRWLTDQAATQFHPHQRLYSTTITALALGSARYFKPSDDTALSDDVQSALPHVFSIITYNRSLAQRVPHPVQAARRLKIDALLSHAWDIPDEPCIYIPKGTLQLPRASPPVYTVKPDATVFFLLDTNVQAIIGDSETIGKACTSIVCPDIVGHGVLHWVIEYKQERDRLVSTRQVLVGLVSGLYQRCALGFPEHFLFGIIHHSGTLDVIAATWVQEDTNQVQPGEHKTQDVQPAENKVQEKVDTNVLVDGKIPGRPKIVVYRLGEFKTSNSTEMLRLYLLMRRTRKLARVYREEIVTLSSSSIQQRPLSDDSFQWPFPAPQGPSSGRGKKRRLPKVEEGAKGEALDASVISCSSTDWDSESSSGAESGVFAPFSPGKLPRTNLARRIEQLGPGPGTTVQHFLEKLPCDGFDPIDVEMYHC